MKHGSSRRQRNRGGSGRRGQPNKAQVYDSNGPDVRIRGTAYQVHEKYVSLAKDSASAGDEILAESYLQHAEHYQRIINEIEADRAEREDRNSNSNKVERSDQKKGEKQTKSSSSQKDKQEELALPGSILGEDDADKKISAKKAVSKAKSKGKELEASD